MARPITAPIAVKDFAAWTGCSPQLAVATLKRTSCPSCHADDPGDDGLDADDPQDHGSFECFHIFHMRADSGDWT